MLLSFKTELKPNNRQMTQFRQHCGVARHAYNFGNAIILDVLKQRETDKSVKIPSAIDLHKRLIAEIKPSNPWYYESSKASPQKALAEVRTAWDRCFKKVSAQPKFKKKGKSKDSFYLEQGTKAKPAIRNRAVSFSNKSSFGRGSATPTPRAYPPRLQFCRCFRDWGGHGGAPPLQRMKQPCNS